MEIKYLSNGQAVEIMEDLNGKGFLVSNIYEVESDEPWVDSDNPYYTKVVFDEAPTNKLSEKVAALEKQVNDLTGRRYKLLHEIQQIESTSKARLTKLKQIEQLQLLEDFIDGKVTHYVVLNYGSIEIVDFKAAKSEYERDSLKLLSLFGGSNGDLEWRLHQYSDHSGSSARCVPCTSYEMAVSIAREHIAKLIVERPSETILKQARKYDVEVPPAVENDIKDKAISQLQKSIENYEKAISEQKKKIGELMNAEANA